MENIAHAREDQTLYHAITDQYLFRQAHTGRA